MDTTIKFAVIGCGHIGKRHASIIEENPATELVALVDILPREKLSIEKFNVPFFPSLEDYLANRPNADVVIIATPNALHSMQAILCMEKGKHVVIEKPMAIKTSDAKKVINKAREVERHVFAVMQNRYSPPSAWIKEILTKGLLGKIFMIQVNCYWNRDNRYYLKNNWHGKKELDGGTVFTQFSHFIDIIYWLFGDIHDIQARLKSFNHGVLTEFEDSGTVQFTLENGAMGSLNFSTSVWDRNMESTITIIAENGTVKIGGQYMDKVEYCHIKDYTIPSLRVTNPGNEYGGYAGSASNHEYVIQNVVDVLKGKAPIAATAEEGLAVVDMIERIYAAANK